MFTEDVFRLTAFSALSQKMQQQSAFLIVDAFYQHRVDMTRKQAFIKVSDALHEGQEIAFCITLATQVVGISSYSLYDYHRVKSQMYLETDYKEGRLSAMRLMSFHELLVNKCIHQGEAPLAAGFGYTFVLPASRNKGLAKQLFRRRQEDIQLNKNVGVVFAIIRGPYAHLNVSQIVLSSLLETEEKVNGRGSEHRVKVTGVWMDISHFEKVLQLPVSTLNNFSGSPAMTKLIADCGFVPVGFFRSLSPVWVTTRAALRCREG